MRARETLVALILTSAIPFGAEGANLRPTDIPGNAEAGREFALVACTGCHVVAANQRFAPLLTGAPDFVTIANRPDVTAAALRRKLATLPHIPSKGQMANPELSDKELADVVAYVMSTRTRQGD
jgi:mono/diheme cytochrome c family protein